MRSNGVGTRFVMLGVMLGGSVSACQKPLPPPPPEDAELHITSDTGAPVEGAEIVAGGATVERSDKDGIARLKVAGEVGDSFEIRVSCPQGYLSPGGSIRLQVLGIPGAPPARHSVTCPRARHSVVVAVRADGGAHLPILHLGKEIGRTDGAGAAHLLFEMGKGTRTEIVLATNDEDHKKLHPQNPAYVVEARERDDVQVFAVKFTKDKPPVKKGGPVKRGPIPL